MQVCEGRKIFQGTAIGRLNILQKAQNQVIREKIEDTDSEVNRFKQAKEQAKNQLEALYSKALKEVGEVNAAIFEVHLMMLDDEDYNESIVNMIIGQKVNAEYAAAVTGDNFSRMFADMSDEYFKARAIDVGDISERLVGILCGKGEAASENMEPQIILAEDLAPSETVQMDKEMLLGFVTHKGSANSHTAILARTMGIPALMGIEIMKEWHGKMGILDGDNGKLIIEPDEETLSEYKKKQENELEQKELLQTLKGKENVTKSGRRIKLYANIGNVSDLAQVLANDGEGIGLFRSEFIYLGRNDFPTEEEQFAIYRQVAETMAGKLVIIRTLDIGADKMVDYFNLGYEENPAMGYRAIRICLSEVDIFKTQLRAIFRASYYGNIAIMYPMITSLEEVIRIKEIVRGVKEELSQENIPFANIQQGIMVETPAAAIISDILAKEVDFFSIGTNDLSQYTMAIDRQNSKIEQFYNPHHEAVIRLIKHVVENAHREGKWAGICGELGADSGLTELFMDIGVDELSVSPRFILPIRKVIRELE